MEVVWSEETQEKDDGYAYKDEAGDSFGSVFSEDELGEIVNWLFGG